MKSCAIVSALAILALSGMPLMGAEATDIDFAHQVAPLIKERCGKCHLGDKRKGGLSMNTRASLLKGSENGEVIEPGNAAGSLLMELVTTEDNDTRMPPRKGGGDPLSAAEVAILKSWIDQNLPWEEGFAFAKPAWEPPLKPRTPVLPPASEGRANPVDRILDAYLEDREIARPQPLDDAGFLRRLSLDVVGLLPEPDAVEELAAQTDPQRRARVIAAMLGDNVAYAEHWLTFWNDLLRNDYAGTGYIDGGRKQITPWLYRSLLENKPYDQFVRELIAPVEESAGFIDGIQWRGNVNASQTRQVQFAQNISQVFLGINMKCASCHDSFVDDWKLEEAYNLAAVYSTEPIELHRCDKPTGQMARAAWLFPELGEVDPEAGQPERLRQLANLMVHPENGRFTRTIVNRIWHRLMGRGIVHPVDAMHTEPWNEDLLDYLAAHLAEHGYDLKKTIELIVSSQAYQSRAVAIEDEPEPGEFVYRGPLAKRMTAEQFVDAVWQITGAGPSRPTAQVLALKAGHSGRGNVAVNGKWVWSNAGVTPVPGETITLRKTFELPGNPRRAEGVITADNEYTLYVNGRSIGNDGAWATVESYPLEDALRAGENEILIVGRNAGAKPSAAGVYFEARVRVGDPGKNAGEEIIAISTDDSWAWTPRQPSRQGQFEEPPVDWQPVAVVPMKNWADRVDDQIRASLAQAESDKPELIRASLVKSDLLMRSLGRPNREQVVTVRPEQLTTLEAIDLANGEILAKTLQRGAVNLASDGNRSVRELIDWLYQFALCRPPAEDEAAVASEIAGSQLTPQGVEDLLWAVCMLPEFQLIR